jgi:hypothetical protein
MQLSKRLGRQVCDLQYLIPFPRMITFPFVVIRRLPQHQLFSTPASTVPAAASTARRD